jgi:hypothetical protein
VETGLSLLRRSKACNRPGAPGIFQTAMKLLVVCLAAAGVAAAQIGYPGGYPPLGYPGGYPPGGYPPGYPSPYPGGGPVPNTGGGIPSPRRGKQPNDSKNKNQPLPNFRGKLKQMDSKTISLELDDYRVMEFRVTGKTSYTKNGQALKSPKFNSDFNPGDQISVEATEEPDASMTAVNVYWEKAAAAASSDSKNDKNDGVVDTWKDAPKQTSDKTPAGPPDPNDPGPPKLKRGNTADNQGPAAAPAPQQTASNAPLPKVNLPPAPAGPPDPNDPGPPVLKRGKAADNDGPAAVSVPPDASPSQPQPVRSQPAPRQTASNLPLPDVNLPPGPSPRAEREQDQAPLAPRQEDALIQRASEAALEFTETLPNYVCQEMMNRSQSESQPANWRPIDVVSMEVVYENGKENYRNLALNGKPTSKPISELGGAYSTGEFGTVLIDLFSPATAAEFHRRGESRISGVLAKLYDFNVRRENSHWDLHFGSQTYSPAYSGSVWIDPANARVLRIEMEAQSLPKDFPADHVESATEYSYVRLGDAKQYLLPVHAETLSCQRGTPYCSKNAIDFRNYHKYTGESTVEFGGVKQ